MQKERTISLVGVSTWVSERVSSGGPLIAQLRSEVARSRVVAFYVLIRTYSAYLIEVASSHEHHLRLAAASLLEPVHRAARVVPECRFVIVRSTLWYVVR